MKQIALDASCLGRRKTGNETYTRGLLRGIEHLGNNRVEFRPLIMPCFSEWQSDCLQWTRIPQSAFLLRNSLYIPRVLKRMQVDLYHAMYWVRPALQCPWVVTIHDVSFVRHPEWFRPGEARAYSTLVGMAAKGARRVLTVSEFSRNEICEVFSIPPEKVVVTWNACPERKAVSEAGNQDGHYFLAVGNLHPRKNLVKLIEAFTLLAENEPEQRLVVVGQSAWLYDDVFASARAFGVTTRIEFAGYVPEERLFELYERATALVYPSLYEGFGLPVIEAMQAGCPVIAADVPVLREIAGDAALFADPASAEALAEKMKAAIGNKTLREDLRVRGWRNIQRFSWKETAQRTLRAYCEALAD